MDIFMAKGQVGVLERLGVCGFCDEIKELTMLKTGIHQPKIKYLTEISAYSLIAFLTPFFLFQSQFLLGTVVNMMLISGALYAKGKEMLPLIFLPSVAVLAKGVLFGPLTIYLLFMLPFIWVANAALVYTIKLTHIKKSKNLATSMAYAGTLKALALLTSAALLFSMGIIPVEFLMTFGLMQLVTAITAAAIIFPVHQWRVKSQK